MEIKNNKLIHVTNEDIINGTFDIPNNIEIITPKAFFYCTDLQKINISNKIISIGEYAFNHCSNLKDVNINSNINTIGQYAFRECYNLDTINIPKNVTVIDKATFEDCINLNNIVISSNISKIGLYSFYGCKKLNKITISEDTIHTNLNIICREIKNQTNNDISIVMKTSLFNIIDSISQSNLNNKEKKTEYVINNLTINNREIDLKKFKKNYKYKKLNNESIVYNTYLDEIRKEELLNKIKNELENNNIYFKIYFDYSEHREFINKIIDNLNKYSNYNYINDFNNYIESYIKKIKTSGYSINKLQNNISMIELKKYLENYKITKSDNDEKINIFNLKNDLNMYSLYISAFFHNTIIEFNKIIKIKQLKQLFNELIIKSQKKILLKNILSKSNNKINNNLLEILNNSIDNELINFEKENIILNELKDLIHTYIKKIKLYIQYIENYNLNYNKYGNEELTTLQKDEIIKNIESIINMIQELYNKANLIINNNLS